MHKSIGILTHYYNSTNYGGILQSYALCKYLNDLGVQTKQVCFDASKNPLSTYMKIKKALIYGKRTIEELLHPKSLIQINKRKAAVRNFRNQIPHSDKVYTYKNIKSVDKYFDVFITGSDQVWNPIVLNDAYSLMFTEKPKYSYAASIASDTIPYERTEYFKNFLDTFSGISVRERNAQKILPRQSILVLDPVFFLSKEQWEGIASKRRIEEPYVFCYFLGDSSEDKKRVINFAREKGLKVANIPFLKDYYRKSDNLRFDYSLCDTSPNDFLSLILNAEYVFTDSFHAICFSYIFKKQFFAFDRKSKAKMGSRINDILFTLDLTNRYIGSEQGIPADCADIDYNEPSSIFLSLKNESVNYISSIIRGLINE